MAGAPARGEERHRRELHALAARLGVADRVYAVGFRTTPTLVYGAADVVAVPSNAPDPLPNAALEAAAAGCAWWRPPTAGCRRSCATARRAGSWPRATRRRWPACSPSWPPTPSQGARLGAAAAVDVRARFARPRLLDAVQALYDRLLG